MADNAGDIQKMYLEYFGRPADPNGLNFWVGAMDRNPNLLAQIQHDFSSSTEYVGMYGDLSNHDAVVAVYRNMFGRAGDAEGVKFWADALDSHALTIDGMVNEMVKAAQTAQNDDSLVFNGRLAVAVEYTRHLDTQAEISAYMGPRAFGIASGLIDSIVDLYSAAAARNPGVIDDNIAQVVGTPVAAKALHAVA